MKTTKSPLAILRRALGITQSNLAQRLGVTRVTVGNWEKTEAPRVAMLAMETIQRSISSPEKTRAEESGKI
jgi:DNA-binding XRE family transcriptional regulator